MWVSLFFKSVIEFIDKISAKHLKALILLLLSVFLSTSVVILNKVDRVADTLQALTANLDKRDSAIEKRIDIKMNNMFSDASQIFERYTVSNAEDLKTIIDKSSISADNSFLLKKLIEKSVQEIISEVKKTQFKTRYIPKDSLNIKVEKVSSNTKPFPLYVANQKP